MIGHKTSGDWTDVTSYGRNEIVFEGRNKEYGAFLVRQRYNGTLLLALLISASFGAMVAAVPMVMSLFHKPKVERKTDDNSVKINPTYIDTRIHIDVPKPPVAPHHTNVTSNTAPFRVVHNEVIETIPTNTITATPTDNPANTGNPNDGLAPNTEGTSTPVDPTPDKSHVFTIVQVKPEFSGGSVLDYLQKNTAYPQEYVDAGISGIVYYTFIVEADGSVSNIEIQRGVAGGPMLADEVKKAIQKMPKWKPGMQNGYPVRVQYSGRIAFMLREE